MEVFLSLQKVRSFRAELLWSKWRRKEKTNHNQVHAVTVTCIHCRPGCSTVLLYSLLPPLASGDIQVPPTAFIDPESSVLDICLNSLLETVTLSRRNKSKWGLCLAWFCNVSRALRNVKGTSHVFLWTGWSVVVSFWEFLCNWSEMHFEALISWKLCL